MSIADKYTTLTTEKIPKVYEAGYKKGKAEGGDSEGAYNQGVEDGKKSEYDAFWDSLQDNGNRTDYYCGFAGWTGECFKPKYDMNVSQSYMMFRGCKIEDLGECLRAAGVKVYIKGTSNQLYAFTHSQTLKIIDEIYFTTPLASTASMFSWSSKLEEIRQPLLVDENTKHGGGFESLYGLKEVRFNGTIGQNGLDFRWSTKLSKASIESVITALSDDATDKSITLSKTAVENAFSESEKTTIPFGFDTSYEGINVTAIDNGDGTVTVNGFVSDDVEFNYEDAVGTFTAGSYIISVPEIDCGYVGFECYDLDGNKLTAEYSGDYTWALNTDKSFVVKACVYLQYGEYTDYVIPYPTIQLANSFDALIATKPNWTINLV